MYVYIYIYIDREREREREKKLIKKGGGLSAYPVMARNGEMISSMGSIPVRVLISKNTNIICDQTLELISREGDPRHVDVVDDIGHAYGEQKSLCFVRMASSEPASPTLHLIKKLPFNAVDVVHWPAMDEW